MTLLFTQLMKNMKQLTAVASLGLYLIPAAGFLWLIDFVTAPMGGIVFFSAVFTVALAGFASAVVLFHLLGRVFK